MLRFPVLIAVALLATLPQVHGQQLPGTQPLIWDDDIGSRMVDGIDHFLLREIEQSSERRSQQWQPDYASADAYQASLEPSRKRLARILGLRDQRIQPTSLEVIHRLGEPAVVGRGKGYIIEAVRWPVLEGVDGEGLLISPESGKPLATEIAIPDASQTPEDLVGLTGDVPAASQYVRRLAESGCQVLVPTIINRELQERGPPHGERRVRLSNREFLYRPSFVLGRHIIGYELQKVLAAVECFDGAGVKQVGVIGWGDGGMLALCAAALDERIASTCVSGYFGDRRGIWQEPLDRNVFGLLEQFGDAELAAMIVPRALTLEACRGPELEITGPPGAPGRLSSQSLEAVTNEVSQAQDLVQPLDMSSRIRLVVSESGRGAFGTDESLKSFLVALVPGAELVEPGERPQWANDTKPDVADRHERQLRQIERHTQRVLEDSPFARSQFMQKLDTSALPAYEASAAEYRKTFAEEVIGRFDQELLPPQPRSRPFMKTASWDGYEIALDVYPDVIAYGLLLMPNHIAAGERRPVVVCQHGLEGRPQDTVTGNHDAYHEFAAKLADEGFIVFAPQNPYLFHDRFRTLQRKANPLQKTLFSIITAQHQQILTWLKTLPEVDGQRIAFYGLSYGGKTAMRVPALLPEYRLSICSADFNDWVWKNASTLAPHSYVWTGEYEIFEFDLGSTFNYSEMAALIAPRPFMVERGHFDGVAPDERVALEFAKVRHLYQARLGIGDRTEIEWFVGPHTINGKGTFQFLRKHLNWPAENAGQPK